LGFLQAMIAGKLPQPPITETLGFRLTEAEHGRAVFVGEPQMRHYNPICLVPESRGAILTRESEEALWQTFFTAAPAQRREFEPSSKRRKRRPAVSPAGTA
jgi:hypothetical protein